MVAARNMGRRGLVEWRLRRFQGVDEVFVELYVALGEGDNTAHSLPRWKDR